MNTNEIARQKYVQLMELVEEIEDQVANLEKQPRTEATTARLAALQEQLAKHRTELQRASDGCGRPHGHL